MRAKYLIFIVVCLFFFIGGYCLSQYRISYLESEVSILKEKVAGMEELRNRYAGWGQYLADELYRLEQTYMRYR